MLYRRGLPRPYATFLRTALILVLCFVGVAANAGSFPADASPARSEESQNIQFGSRAVELTIHESPGNQEWAQRVVEVVTAAGPALEEIIGVPYPGPEAMAISERTDEQLAGYAGTAGCSHVVCHIRLSSYFDDTTLLHELTHAWTQSFRNRWLAEGMAEYISDRAAARIDGRPFPILAAAGDRPPFPLLDWMLTIDFATASDEQITNEYEGYYWSLRFVEQLEATIGPEALKRAMAIVVPLQAGTVGVRRFMDAIDDAGARADDLFIRYVFPPEREQEIRDRRTSRDTLAAIGARSAAEAPELSQDVLGPVRDQVANWEFAPALATLDRLNAGLTAYLQLKPQLAALSARATETGLAYPHPLQNATASWDFAPYVETIDEANAAIDAYIAAEQELSAPRSIWQQIGLLGRNPDAELERAARAFAAADFTGTIEHSGAAEAGLEKGNSRALTNLLLGAALLALVLAAGVLILRWALRAEPSPTGA